MFHFKRNFAPDLLKNHSVSFSGSTLFLDDYEFLNVFNENDKSFRDIILDLETNCDIAVTSAASALGTTEDLESTLKNDDILLNAESPELSTKEFIPDIVNYPYEVNKQYELLQARYIENNCFEISIFSIKPIEERKFTLFGFKTKRLYETAWHYYKIHTD